MKFEEFKSGKYRQQYQYKSFLPAKINHAWTWDDPRINVMLEKATKALGELNAFTLIVPDVDLFIRMHMLLRRPIHPAALKAHEPRSMKWCWMSRR